MQISLIRTTVGARFRSAAYNKLVASSSEEIRTFSGHMFSKIGRVYSSPPTSLICPINIRDVKTFGIQKGCKGQTWSHLVVASQLQCCGTIN